MGDGDDDATRAECVIEVTYHQLPLADGDTFPEVDLQDWGRLVYTNEGVVVILTGIHTGLVNLALEVRSTPPSAGASSEGWDEVAEESVAVPKGQLRVTSLITDIPEDLPLLTPHGPGRYRVRVEARGRDTDWDGTADEPFEDYHVTIWPDRPEEAAET